MEQVGWWSWSTDQGARAVLKRPLYRDLGLQYSDFRGRELTVATVNFWPYFKIVPGPHGSLKPHSGWNANIIKTLANKLNFTYRMVTPADRQWGRVMKNGTVNGMVGMVARHEAHLAACDISMTAIRRTVVDFTAPYRLDYVTMVSAAPVEKNKALAVFATFTIQVWLTLVVVTLVMGPAVTVVSRLRAKCLQDEPHLPLATFSFNVYRSLVRQDTDLLSQNWDLRILIFFWSLFCLAIYAMYAGTLTTFLVIPAYEKPIDSLWDLLDAMKHKGYMPIVMFAGVIEYFFKTAEHGIFKDIWDLFDPSRGYEYSAFKKLDHVLTGKYVQIVPEFAVKVHVLERGQHKFHMAKYPFNPQYQAVVCTKGSPYKVAFNNIISHIWSAGLLDKWIDAEMQKVISWEESVPKEAFNLVQLQAAFFLLLMGCFLAGLVLLLEMFLCPLIPKH